MNNNDRKSFFPWYAYTREDRNVISLRKKHGFFGYGLYTAFLEMLFERNGEIVREEIPEIEYALRLDTAEEQAILKSIIEDFGLFDIDDQTGTITCQRISEHIAFLEGRSKAAAEKANKRWGKAEDDESPEKCNGNASAMPQQCNGNASAMQINKIRKDNIREDKIKRDEIKEKEIRGEENIENPLPPISPQSGEILPPSASWYEFIKKYPSVENDVKAPSMFSGIDFSLLDLALQRTPAFSHCKMSELIANYADIVRPPPEN